MNEQQSKLKKALLAKVSVEKTAGIGSSIGKALKGLKGGGSGAKKLDQGTIKDLAKELASQSKKLKDAEASGLFGTKWKKDYFTKNKGIKNLIENTAVLTGAGLAIGGASAGISAGLDAAGNPIRKGIMRKRMMKKNPDLASANTKDVKSAFNTLFRFSPEMAADPNVAGAFVRKGLEFKDVGIQSSDVKTLTDIQRAVGDRKRSKAVKGIMSAEQLSSMKNLTDSGISGK